MILDLSRRELAANGGNPLRTKPWLDNFTIGGEERQAALRVLDSGYLSLFEGSYSPNHPFSFYGGPEVQGLEYEWSQYYECKHSISVNSATSGLYAAIGALGIGFGDEVIVSPYTMSACAIAPLIYGAIPVFADVELETGSLDPKSIEKKITPRTKAILLIHQFGIPANMDAIMKIAKKHNLKVVEDCAQAHGAKYNNKYVGTIGDVGVFSLNVNKTLQTGEGGICITNNNDLAYRLQLIRNHGESVVGPAGYNDIVNIAGFNYRLTELQAAIAREQLKKLGELNAVRLELVEQLTEGISEIPFFRILNNPINCLSTYYTYPLRYIEEEAGVSRNSFVTALNAEGVNFSQGYSQPLYLQPLYQEKILFKNGYPFSAPANSKCMMDYNKGICPHTERLYYNEMIINEHVRYPHTSEDIDDLINAINKISNY